MGMPELILVFGLPHLCREYVGIVVLNHTPAPGRYTFTGAAFPAHMQLVEVAVMNALKGNPDLPDTVFYLLQAVRLQMLPLVESAYQKYIGGMGSPLAEYPSFGCLVEAEVEVAGSKIRQCNAATLCEMGQPFLVIGVTPFNCICIGFEPRIIF